MYRAALIIFIIVNKRLINVTKVNSTTRVSLYVIHPATYFDIFMSSDQHTDQGFYTQPQIHCLHMKL